MDDQASEKEAGLQTLPEKPEETPFLGLQKEEQGAKEAPSPAWAPRSGSAGAESEEKDTLPEEQRIQNVKCRALRSPIPTAANIPDQQVLGASLLLPSFQNLL